MVIKEAARSLHTACSCVQPSETARAGHSYGHNDHKLGGEAAHANEFFGLARTYFFFF